MGWAVNATPHPFYPWEGDPVPIIDKAGWAPKLIWMVQKISTPPGYEPLTVQCIAICYIDCYPVYLYVEY